MADLNKELENRIIALDKDIIDFVKKDIKKIDSRIMEHIAAVPVNQSESLSVSQAIVAAHIKAEADRLLKQAEADMYAPLKSKLAALLQRIGTERGYAFILNTDGDALPFVNPACGDDITAEVVDYLIHNS